MEFKLWIELRRSTFAPAFHPITQSEKMLPLLHVSTKQQSIMGITKQLNVQTEKRRDSPVRSM